MNSFQVQCRDKKVSRYKEEAVREIIVQGERKSVISRPSDSFFGSSLFDAGYYSLLTLTFFSPHRHYFPLPRDGINGSFDSVSLGTNSPKRMSNRRPSEAPRSSSGRLVDKRFVKAEIATVASWTGDSGGRQP